MTFAGAIATLSIMIAPSAPSAESTAAAPPVVEIDQGALVGRVADSVAAFKNIPYASPPVGAARWRPPGPAPSWSEPRDASTYGAICIQAPANGDPGVGPLPMSEDCLNLNVWSPTQASAPAPVMVWIHGGALNNGSGTAALYDGSRLAADGMVVVTINYRLGRLGFFDHPALASERPSDEPAANYGVMDVIAALKWVRANIAAFGGDPGNVTIFGESAGGLLVNRMMIAPEAKGLFDRAIVQSGLGRELQTPLDRPLASDLPSARDRGAAWARRQNLTTAEDLRNAPAELFLNEPPVFANGDLNLIDGKVITTTVEAAFKSGQQAPVPYLIGTNSAEFWWMRPSNQNGYGRIDDDMTWLERAEHVQAYGGVAGFDQQFITDAVFAEPARQLARWHAAAGHPAYLYRFDISSPTSTEPHGGATHAVERPYVFGWLNILPYPVLDHDRTASEQMMGYWTSFARSGDPNGVGRPEWPRIRANDERLIRFGNGGTEAIPAPDAARLDLIQRFRDRRRR